MYATKCDYNTIKYVPRLSRNCIFFRHLLKEMFIVTIGQVQVVGGPDDSIVFVSLGQGKYFDSVARCVAF